MKKILILSAVLLLIFAGCSSRYNENGDNSGNPPVRTAARNRPAANPTAPPVLNTSVPQTPAPERENQQLGYYETEYDLKDENRNTNMALATEAINGVTVMPGEEFSYNDTIGNTTEENGYKVATVFRNGEKAKSYGGGVCQVSTTLCNAAIAAGMKITERHDHSRPVNYVKGGMEAATSNSGNLDFRFTNTKPHPIVISAQSQNGVISVSIKEAR